MAAALEVKTQAHTIDTADTVIDRQVGGKPGVAAGGVGNMRWRSIVDIVQRAVELDIVVPFVGSAQVEIADPWQIVVVDLTPCCQ